MRSHSGEDVVSSPKISASEDPSAWATSRRTRIDALPTPSSRFARCRSDTAEAAEIAGQPLDATLAERLNRDYSAQSETYRRLLSACLGAIADGWMCNREANGIRFGRVIKAGPETHGFSVDVVDMKDCVGPHHIHP